MRGGLPVHADPSPGQRRQLELECRADALAALGTDGAAVGLSNPPGYRESQADAGDIGRGAPLERIEDPAHVVRVNPDALVDEHAEQERRRRPD